MYLALSLFFLHYSNVHDMLHNCLLVKKHGFMSTMQISYKE